MLLRGFVRDQQEALWRAVQGVIAAAPFRHMVTPGGFTMSVANTSCGAWGWVSDRRGYRYAETDPESGKPWPAMPGLFADLYASAAEAAGYSGFTTDSCLINRYVPGARLSLHQDKDEHVFGAPIVSVSLGLPATFLWGGAKRAEKPRRIRLESGDVVAWGGPTRLFFHGVDHFAAGEHPITGTCRINLTFRRAK